MPRQKGFSPLIIIIVVAILGLVAFFGFKNFNSPNPPTKTLPSSNNPPVQKEETNTNLLVPKLTYTGAYNGPLCDASSKMGDSAPLDLHFENMDRNGVTCVIAYTFAEEVVSTDHIKGIIKKYPGRIIPFYSPGFGGVEAGKYVGNELTKMFEMALPMAENHLGKNIIQGIGEIEMFQWNIPHNDPKIMQIFDFAKKNNLKVMFHPLPGRSSQIKDILERYPEITFLIHMFQDDFAKERSNLITLLKDHKNLYYTIDVDHLLYDRSAGTGLLYKYQDQDTKVGKAGFVRDFDSKYEAMLKADLALYKPLIEAVPDQVTWGTEMNTRYTYEPEVYDRMIKFIRLFIGSLDPSIQESIGYKNTLNTFGN